MGGVNGGQMLGMVRQGTRDFEPELALLPGALVPVLFSTEVLLPNPMTLKGFYP